MKNINLFELFIECNETGKKGKVSGPFLSEEMINNEKKMFQKYALPFTTLVIIFRDVISNPLNLGEESMINDTQNPFNTINSITPNDSWYLQEEKRWVELNINIVSRKIYKDNSDILPNVKLINSLWHRGFVNVLFDLERCSYADKVWKWIYLIGDKYDANTISNIRGICSEGLYVKDLFTKDVKNLCNYCHLVFGVDKYKTAKLFTTRKPEEFDINNENIWRRAYALIQVAAIFAEREDLKSARTYYKKSITALKGDNCQCNYVKRFEEFEKYVKTHRTSILSSNF